MTELEIPVLQDWARHRGGALPTTLGATGIPLARLGGDRARNPDPPPGPPTIWDGYTRLVECVAAYQTLRDLQGGPTD